MPAPSLAVEDRTAILRPAKGGPSWADIAREIARRQAPAGPPTRPAPVVRLALVPTRPAAPMPVAAPPRARKAAPAPWAKLHDRWGLDALIDRERERAAKVVDIPTRPVRGPEEKKTIRKVHLGALLKLPEWSGSSVEFTETLVIIRHPSGAEMRLMAHKIAP